MSEKILSEKIIELEEKIRLLETELASGSKSESRLRRAELASGSGNWELHLDTGKILGSEGAIKLYGLERDEFNYDEVKGIPLPEYRPLLDKSLKDLISGVKPYDIEFRIRNAKNGHIIEIHSTAEYNRESRTVFGVIRDITQQKISEELIKRKNRDLGILLDVTMELLETSDKKEVLKNLLEAGNSIVGLDTGAVYTIDDQKLFLVSTIPQLPPDYPDEFRYARLENHPHIARTLNAGSPLILQNVEENTFTEQEKLIISKRNMKSLLFIPLISSGHNLGIIILGTVNRLHKFEDHEIAFCRTISNIASLAMENSQLISILKTARDKAEESDRLKTAFLHNISHEIRTPLNAIVGFSTFLDQPDLSDSDRRKFIDIIIQSSNQLLNILNDIFNVSQIETGQVLLKEGPVDIIKTLNTLYSLFLPESESKGLDFRLEIQDTQGDCIKILCDEGKITQVLSNFLGNAFKFTTYGHVILGCSIKNSTIIFRVEDTGVGIAESEQKKIFRRFYQVDKLVSREYSGTGLGLSISEAYAKLMGGSIRVESELGKGSVFLLELPYKSVSTDMINLVEEEKPRGLIKSGNSTILIAEDERSNFQLLEFMLDKSGVNIIHANNGLEAVEMFKSSADIDLVLMDIKMPVMDGYTATSEIKKIRPGVPVIVQTAFADLHDRQKAFDSGCSDFLAKPFNKDQLLSLIKKYIP